MNLATIQVPLDRAFMERPDLTVLDFTLTVKASLPPGSEVICTMGWIVEEDATVDLLRLLVATR